MDSKYDHFTLFTLHMRGKYYDKLFQGTSDHVLFPYYFQV